MPCPLLHNGEMGTENIRGAPGIRLRHTLGDECRSASISSSTRHHLLSLSLRRLRGLRMRLLMAARCPHMQATCRQHAGNMQATCSSRAFSGESQHATIMLHDATHPPLSGYAARRGRFTDALHMSRRALLRLLYATRPLACYTMSLSLCPNFSGFLPIVRLRASTWRYARARLFCWQQS